MPYFFMFGKYSSESVKQISGDRTENVVKLVEELGGRVKDIYALLGQYDVVCIVELPTMSDAMKASIALGRLTGISFSTAFAVPVGEFDQMAARL